MAAFGSLWRGLAGFGGFCRYLVVSPFGGVWRRLVPFGGVWRCLAACSGVLGSVLAVLGGVWRSLAAFGGV